MEAKRQQLYEEGKQRVVRRPSAGVEEGLKKQVEKQQDEIRRLKVSVIIVMFMNHLVWSKLTVLCLLPPPGKACRLGGHHTSTGGQATGK